MRYWAQVVLLPDENWKSTDQWGSSELCHAIKQQEYKRKLKLLFRWKGDGERCVCHVEGALRNVRLQILIESLPGKTYIIPFRIWLWTLTSTESDVFQLEIKTTTILKQTRYDTTRRYEDFIHTRYFQQFIHHNRLATYLPNYHQGIKLLIL